MFTLFAWNDGSDSPIQAIEARNELVKLFCKLQSVTCISPKSRKDLILINVVKLVKVFIFVVVFEELTFVRVAKIGQLLEFIDVWAIRLNSRDRLRSPVRCLILKLNIFHSGQLLSFIFTHFL